MSCKMTVHMILSYPGNAFQVHKFTCLFRHEWSALLTIHDHSGLYKPILYLSPTWLSSEHTLYYLPWTYLSQGIGRLLSMLGGWEGGSSDRWTDKWTVSDCLILLRTCMRTHAGKLFVESAVHNWNEYTWLLIIT